MHRFVTRCAAAFPVAFAVATAFLITAVPAFAEGGGGDPPSPSAPDPALRTVVDAAHGFALVVPDTHDVMRSGVQWYLHGWLDGDAMVPDVAIAFLPGVSAEQALERDYPPSAEAHPVQLGPGTAGLRVTATYEAPDGTTYRIVGYLVEGADGSYRIDRYEGLDWAPFDDVARSFHFVEFVQEAAAFR